MKADPVLLMPPPVAVSLSEVCHVCIPVSPSSGDGAAVAHAPGEVPWNGLNQVVGQAWVEGELSSRRPGSEVAAAVTADR